MCHMHRTPHMPHTIHASQSTCTYHTCTVTCHIHKCTCHTRHAIHSSHQYTFTRVTHAHSNTQMHSLQISQHTHHTPYTCRAAHTNSHRLLVHACHLLIHTTYTYIAHANMCLMVCTHQMSTWQCTLHIHPTKPRTIACHILLPTCMHTTQAMCYMYTHHRHTPHI